MHNFFRKILGKTLAFLSAVFWSRRYRLASIITSSFALQAFSCTYGSPDDVEHSCHGLEFQLLHESNPYYSECEQKIVDQLVLANRVKEQYGENSNEYISQWNESLRTARNIAETCEMSTLKIDGTVSCYD